ARPDHLGLASVGVRRADRGDHRQPPLADQERAQVRQVNRRTRGDRNGPNPRGGAAQAPPRDPPQPAGASARRGAEGAYERDRRDTAVSPARLVTVSAAAGFHSGLRAVHPDQGTIGERLAVAGAPATAVASALVSRGAARLSVEAIVFVRTQDDDLAFG